MGIFGAMTTAITGLRSQSTALEHISNNIANSQTVGYKRLDTSFVDLVPDSDPRQQSLGVVQALSRATNDVQGDIENADVGTFMAVNGDGYFIVTEQGGTTDGLPVFTGENLYTRRGDFDLDRNGFLVNETNYFLKGFAIDAVTGNVTGSLPDVIRVTNDFLPALATSKVNYRANLPEYPLTATADTGTPNSELLNVATFAVDPTTAGVGYVQGNESTLFIDQSVAGGAVTTFDGTGAPVNVQLRWAKLNIPTVTNGTVDISGDLDDVTGLGLSNGDQLTLTIDTQTFTIGFNTTGAPGVGEDAAIDLLGGDDADAGGDDATGATLIGIINGLFTGTPAALNGANQLEITSPTNTNIVFTGSDASVISLLGLDTIGSGSTTTRTVPTDATWNLFYLEDSNAAGTTPAWRNIGTDYTFVTGVMNPVVSTVNIANMTVDGVSLGSIDIEHGADGITQFSDPNGSARVTEIRQNGFSAGAFTGVNISDAGRVVASYSNGRSLEIAEVSLAAFNGDKFLKRIDGGAYRETPESGAPILGSQGGRIIGSALEASNTDIADEFSKLIVTQQAYAANTRIISTSDEMIQEALNIIR